MRSRPVPLTITSARKLRLPAVASATFSSGIFDVCPFARGVTMPQRSGDGQRRIDSARQIPCWQNVVDRGRELRGTGDQWKSDAGIDR